MPESMRYNFKDESMRFIEKVAVRRKFGLQAKNYPIKKGMVTLIVL